MEVDLCISPTRGERSIKESKSVLGADASPGSGCRRFTSRALWGNGEVTPALGKHSKSRAGRLFLFVVVTVSVAVE